MAERRSDIDYDKIVYQYAQDKMAESLLEMSESFAKGITLEEAVDKVKEVNTWVDFIAGENCELYEEYRRKLFLDSSGQLVVVAGVEIDVDVRNKNE